MWGNFLPRGLDGRLWWLALLDLAWTDAREMANQLSLKTNYCFCPMAKLNFLKTKASNTWPSEGTMHVDLPQGLDDVTHRTKYKGGSPLRFRQWGASSSYYFFPWRSGWTLSQVWLCEPGCKGKGKPIKTESMACLSQSWPPPILPVLIQHLDLINKMWKLNQDMLLRHPRSRHHTLSITWGT